VDGLAQHALASHSHPCYTHTAYVNAQMVGERQAPSFLAICQILKMDTEISSKYGLLSVNNSADQQIWQTY